MSDNQKPKNVVDLWELAQDFENKSKESNNILKMKNYPSHIYSKDF